MSKAPVNPEELITPIEAAELLHVAPQTLNVWRCTRRYPLSYVKVGRKVLYVRSEVLKFLSSGRVA